MIYTATGKFGDWFFLGYGHATDPDATEPNGMTAEQKRAYDDGYLAGQLDSAN